MPWPSFFSKKTVSEPIVPVSTDPIQPAALEKSEPEQVVKKSCGCKPLACAPVKCAPVACACACAPVACAPVACAPCAPLSWCVPPKAGSCCKSFPRSLVLRSASETGNEKLTSAPDAEAQEASATK